jgi:hypothetical protein
MPRVHEPEDLPQPENESFPPDLELPRGGDRGSRAALTCGALSLCVLDEEPARPRGRRSLAWLFVPTMQRAVPSFLILHESRKCST